jgi:hypothetical protein
MASAQAATSLSESVRPRALPSIVQHQDVLHALVPCFPPLERVLKFMFRMGESLLENNKRCKNFGRFQPEHSASVLTRSHVMNL